MKVILYLGQNSNITKYDLKDSYIIGVDKGALDLAKASIQMDLAIGDFDSINPEDFDSVKILSKKVIKLNIIKDDTDTEAAVVEAMKISDDITIIGGLQGNRVEHLLANVCLMKKYPCIKMLDDNSYVFSSAENITLHPDEYKFVSIFALENSIISLKGFKYNVNKYKLNLFDSLGVSNEIEALNATLTISKGRVLIIKSKNDMR